MAGWLTYWLSAKYRQRLRGNLSQAFAGAVPRGLLAAAVRGAGLFYDLRYKIDVDFRLADAAEAEVTHRGPLLGAVSFTRRVGRSEVVQTYSLAADSARLDIRLDIKMTQQLVMTPQLQQAIKLLQLSRTDLIDAVR